MTAVPPPLSSREELRLEGGMIPLLAAVTTLGGSWRPSSPTVRWIQESMPHPVDLLSTGLMSATFGPRASEGWGGITHAVGSFQIVLDGTEYEAQGLILRSGSREWLGVILRGRSAAELAQLAERARQAMPRLRIRVWGGPVQVVDVPVVAESEVVLPEVHTATLLPWLDRFWKLASWAANEGI